MGIRGKTASDAQRVTHLVTILYSGEGNVVDFRVGAPRRAAGGRNLEFARQVVKVRVGGEQLGDLNGQR